MIRNESEYQDAVGVLSAQRERLAAYKSQLESRGDLGSAEVKRALAPLRSFQAQLKEEIASYASLKRG